MKNFFKKIMFMFVMLFGATGLVACGEKPNDPPPTEQGTGGTGSSTETGTGGTGSSTETGTGGADTGADSGTSDGSNITQQITEEQAYAMINAEAKKLTNKATAEYETVTNGSMVMAGEFNTTEFLSRNAAVVEAMGGASSAAVQGMIAQMASISEYLNTDVTSKTIEGYKGATKEGYIERHVYDADQEQFKIQESNHTIKDGTNLINYEFSPYSLNSKTKKYIGEDWASYMYLDHMNSSINVAGIIELANCNTFAEYKACLFDLMAKSIPMEINGNVADHATVTSTFVEENGNYILKNHVVLDKLPGEQDGLNMELVGTADMDIYFTADKITKAVLDFDVESLSTMEEEEGGITLQIPFDITIKSGMEIVVNNYNATSSADATYLAGFVGTGADKDLDGNPDIEKTEGGYIYTIVNFLGQNNVAEFGEEITPLGAKELADKVLNEQYEGTKKYYNTEGIVWYTDYECTKVADAELINKTTAPSYVLNLFTKIPLKTDCVKIKLRATDGDDQERNTTLYVSVPTGETAATISIEDIKNEYLFSDSSLGLATNSVIDKITVGDETLSASSFEIEGGQECELTFEMSKFSLVEDNEVRYLVEAVTESQYAAGEFNNPLFSEWRMLAIANYDPSDDTTHTKSLLISELLVEMCFDATGAEAVYVNDQEVAGISETIENAGGSTVRIVIVMPDSQE